MSPKTPPAPADAALRGAAKPTIVYPASTMPRPDMAVLESARHTMVKIHEVVVSPRNARAFRVSRGQFFRIVSIEGPQVGDLNLWNADDLSERFFSGKTRALHATHVGAGDRLWSTMPYLRPMVTISHDTLSWYGWDSDGAGIHDVIGTRCDPYTNLLLGGTGYDFCCHSNLSRALAAELKVERVRRGASYPRRARCLHVHGFRKDTHQYFMKASPVRPGDFIEFFAEINLLGALSACPGGDCSATHSSHVAACYPLKIEIFEPNRTTLGTWTWPSPSEYHRRHGTPAQISANGCRIG